MRLTKASLTGFRGLRDGEYTFAETGATLVTGPAASGKSSLLRVLTAAKDQIGPYFGGLSPGRLAREGEARASLEWRFDAHEREELRVEERMTCEAAFGDAVDFVENDPGVEEALSRFEPSTHGAVYYFPALQRHQLGSGVGYDPSVQRERATSADQTKLSWVSSALVDALRWGEARADGVPYHEAFEAALERFPQSLTLRGYDIFGGVPRLMFSAAGRIRLGIEELGASDAAAVLFAGFAAFVAPRRSVLLLDSPEARVADELRGAFVDALVGMGEDNQTIVATSSAQVLAKRGANVLDVSQVTQRSLTRSQ